MPNFGKLNELTVTANTTAECKLFHITVNGKSPILVVAPATEVNKPYFNEQLRRVSSSVKQVKAGAINASMLEEGRDDDRELYPKFVIKGWRDMLDHETGEEIKFSRKVCEEFLQALPDHVFDYIREFAANTSSFTGMVDVDVQGTAKNS